MMTRIGQLVGGCISAAGVVGEYVVVVAPPGGTTPARRPAFASSLGTNAEVAKALRSAADAIEALNAKDEQESAQN